MAGSDPGVMADSFTVAADGSYAARLSAGPGSELWYPERWTLGGPEPYAVPLPVEQPEEADSSVLPLADGRVLIARRAGPRYAFALLYPSGPDTGERRLGTVEARQLSLLPPAPCGARAYALTPDEDERSTTVWLVAGGASGTPERVARVRGHCTGGAWLDREGQLLAVDRTEARGGLTKTVAVDLGRGGEVSPLLQITEESNDRLLLADPHSGLLLVRSDAPGADRLAWGVLGSHRPLRFPEALHPAHTHLTPFALQPGQALLPERCGVALRADAATGTWLAVWRPGLKELRHIAGPPGWLTGNGVWTADGELHVPYSTSHVPCGLARLRAPLPDPASPAARPVPDKRRTQDQPTAPVPSAREPAGPPVREAPVPPAREAPAQEATPSGPGTGSPSKPGTGSGRGGPPGPGSGPEAAPGAGRGSEPDAGRGTGPGQGDPPGPPSGPGTGPWPGPGAAPGSESGAGPGPWPGPGAAPEAGPRPEAGPETGPWHGPRTTPEPGSWPEAGAGTGPASGPPPGATPGPRPAPPPGAPPASPPAAPPEHPQGIAPQAPPDQAATDQAPPDPGAEPRSGPAADVTGGQHHGHGGPSSGLRGTRGFGVVSAGGAGMFGAWGEPASKPVPLQQAPLTTGMS